MKVARWALVAVILGNLALLAAAGPLKATRLRYEVARQRQALRELSLERRTLIFRVAEARRHDRVVSRAGAFGLELRIRCLAHSSGCCQPAIPRRHRSFFLSGSPVRDRHFRRSS